MTKKTQYQHKLEYNNTYNRTNYRSFSVRFSLVNEKDMINWLEKKNGVKEYISELIAADMKKNKNKKPKKTAEKKTKKPAVKKAPAKAKKAPAKKTKKK